jgi:hypothetical protein
MTFFISSNTFLGVVKLYVSRGEYLVLLEMLLIECSLRTQIHEEKQT